MRRSAPFLFFILLGVLSCTQRQQPYVWLIGDSTMAGKNPSLAPESGWGEGLKRWAINDRQIRNHAVNGKSSKSFLAQGFWAPVLDSLRRGDYVIIQFGHNDERPDPGRHTDPLTYKDLLKKYIAETRAKGAIPVICSPIVRWHFNQAGELLDTHGAYLRAASAAATESHAVFIDMEAASRKWVTSRGAVRSKAIFMISDPDQWTNWPRGAHDSVHLNENGAAVVARLFVRETSTKKLALAGFFQAAP